MERKHKILFIHPAAEQDLKIEGNLKFPPMGLTFLAAMVREAGYPVMIFDASVIANSTAELLRLLADFQPTIVGLSFTSLLVESARQLAAIVKKFNPHIQVIAGGYHPTVCPQEIVADTNFDFVFIGESEISIINWLEKIETGRTDFENVKGLAFQRAGQVIITAPQPLIANLDSLPFPAYDLLPIEKYSSLSTIHQPYVTFIRSRGCPFQCIFCGVQKMFGRSYRCQSPEKTVAEIGILVKKFKVREISFRDSDFLIDKANVEKFCQLLIDCHYDLVWTCNARVDMVNESILSLMKRAGCHLVTFGVESGSQEILDNLKKGISVDQIVSATRAARAAKISFAFDIIIGGIGETKESISETNKLLKKLNPDYVAFTYLTAFPGSELYNEAKKNGWFINNEASDYSYEDLNLNATKLSTDDLSHVLKKSLVSFYFRPRYVIKRLFNSSLGEWKNNLRGLWVIIKNFLTR